jgi:hypothetical protein
VIEARFGVRLHCLPSGRPRAGPGGALGRQGAAPAGLSAHVGPAQAPQGGRGGAGRLPASFPELVKAALPEQARGKPVEIWFQSLPRT